MSSLFSPARCPDISLSCRCRADAGSVSPYAQRETDSSRPRHWLHRKPVECSVGETLPFRGAQSSPFKIGGGRRRGRGEGLESQEQTRASRAFIPSPSVLLEHSFRLLRHSTLWDEATRKRVLCAQVTWHRSDDCDKGEFDDRVARSWGSGHHVT